MNDEPVSIKEERDKISAEGVVEWKTTKTLDQMVVELGDAIEATELQYLKLQEALPKMFGAAGVEEPPATIEEPPGSA
jgi:hypothetical protein